MPIYERAKQFMPFSALKGFEEALLQKERQRISPTELSDEQKKEINEILFSIEQGDRVTIFYFKQGRFHKIDGQIQNFDKTLEVVTINSIEIPFDKITNIYLKEYTQ